jgi:outer membrane protein
MVPTVAYSRFGVRDRRAINGEVALGAGVLRQAGTPGGAVLAMCLAAASPVRAGTLEQALAQAYQNNPQLNSQRAVVRATDEGVPQALSGYKPTVRVTGTVGQEYTSQLSKSPEGSKKITVLTPPAASPGQASVSVPSGGPVYPRTSFGYSPSNVSATLTQTLYNGFQTANRTRLAETNTSAARETLRVTEQTILLNAATAYMDLLRDGALLELQRRNVEVLQEQLRQTRDRFIVGEVTRTDVAQAESRLAAGRASVLTGALAQHQGFDRANPWARGCHTQISIRGAAFTISWMLWLPKTSM